MRGAENDWHLVVEGGHRNIHLQPYVPSMAATLEESLRATDHMRHIGA